MSTAFQAGSINHAEFYHAIQNLCGKNGIRLADFPAMAAYIDYVLLAQRIEADALLAQVQRAENDRYAQLAQNDRERQLISESRRLFLTSKLLDLALTKTEWGAYKKIVSRASCLVPRGTNQRGTRNIFEDFYFEAEARDTAMAENLKRAIAETGARHAVVVTGGFHTVPAASAVFTPRLTKIETGAGSAYLSVFAQEKTPLEKLFEGQKLFLATPPLSDETSQLMQVEMRFDAARHHAYSAMGENNLRGKTIGVLVWLAAVTHADTLFAQEDFTKPFTYWDHPGLFMWDVMTLAIVIVPVVLFLAHRFYRKDKKESRQHAHQKRKQSRQVPKTKPAPPAPAPKPIIVKPATVVEQPVAVKTEPVVITPEPVIEKPAPVVEAGAEPVVEAAPEPVVEHPLAVEAAPEPMVEKNLVEEPAVEEPFVWDSTPLDFFSDAPSLWHNLVTPTAWPNLPPMHDETKRQSSLPEGFVYLDKATSLRVLELLAEVMPKFGIERYSAGDEEHKMALETARVKINTYGWRVIVSSREKGPRLFIDKPEKDDPVAHPVNRRQGALYYIQLLQTELPYGRNDPRRAALIELVLDQVIGPDPIDQDLFSLMNMLEKIHWNSKDPLKRLNKAIQESPLSTAEGLIFFVEDSFNTPGDGLTPEAERVKEILENEQGKKFWETLRSHVPGDTRRRMDAAQKRLLGTKALGLLALLGSLFAVTRQAPAQVFTGINNPRAADPKRDFLYFSFDIHINEKDFERRRPFLEAAIKDARSGSAQKIAV
jgi:hypothetical protein